MHTTSFRRVQAAPLPGKPASAIAVLLCAGSLLLVVKPVQAGQWVHDHNEYDPGPYATLKVDGQAQMGINAFSCPDIIPEAAGKALKLEATGRVRPWYRWVPRESGPGTADPNDQPPSELKVLLRHQGTVMVTSDKSGDHRMTDKEHITGTVLGEEVKGDESASGRTTGGCTKAQWDIKKLRSASTKGETMVNAKGETVVAGPWMNMDVTSSLDGDRVFDGGDGQSNIHGQVYYSGGGSSTVDNRFVKLSRGGRDERPELKDGEWHTYGDSIYSAHDVSGNSAQDFKPELDINAGYEGDWGARPDGTQPNVTPNWSPGGAFSSSFEQSTSRYAGCAKFGRPLTKGGDHSYSGSATGQATSDISYTATDTRDGANAKAFYHLTLHDPLESAGEDSFTTYHIKAPVMNGGPIRRAYGQGTQDDVTIGESTEYGVGVTATTSIGLQQELLGFKADLAGEVSYKSTFKVESSATIKTPPLTVNQFVFLMADHSFQRRHARFWQYDEAGKVKRMVTTDSTGGTYNPAVEVYHEAFKDTKAGDATHYWTPPYDSTVVDVNTLPVATVAPPLKYDYPSGGHA